MSATCNFFPILWKRGEEDSGEICTCFDLQAVGKMIVGQELEKITELELFHNHMTID